MHRLFAFLTLALFPMLLFSPSAMAAPNITVTVRAEPVGADIVYHYTMAHIGPEMIMKLYVAAEPHEYRCEGTVCSGRYSGTLLTMPVDSTWVPDPYFSNARETPTLSAGSTTQPAGWGAEAWRSRAPGET